jgi:hypothetical protein
MNPKIKSKLVASLGVLALSVLVISAVFLVFIRKTSFTTVASSPSDTPISPTTPIVVPPAFTTITAAGDPQTLKQSDLKDLIPSPEDLTPSPEDGTKILNGSKPLQQNPHGFGFFTMTGDSSRIFSSLSNGNWGFADFSRGSELKYIVNPESYVGKTTTGCTTVITRLKTDSSANPDDYVSCSKEDTANNMKETIKNQTATSVGSVGVKSIVLSSDESRLYVGYLDSEITQNNPFIFKQKLGKVQVWSKSQDRYFVSDNFIADIANNFGSQVIGLSNQFNAFTQDTSRSDDFGAYIQTTINSTNMRRVVAINTEVGSKLGRCIVIVEEQDDYSHKRVGSLFLPEHSRYTFTEDDRNSFGNAYAIMDDICLASLGAHESPGIPNSTNHANRIAYFQRNRNQTWKFMCIIQCPVDYEYFGTSMVLSSTGGVVIIGSPQMAGVPSSSDGWVPGPSGGHVYVYIRDNQNVWNLHQTVSDPWSGGDNGNKGNFGWFVNIDKNFRLLTVSGNHDTIYYQSTRKKFPSVQPNCEDNNVFCAYSCIILFPFDNSIQKLVINKGSTSRLFQNISSNDFVDPLFGSQVKIADDYNTIVVGSPMNSNIRIWKLVVS